MITKLSTKARESRTLTAHFVGSLSASVLRRLNATPIPPRSWPHQVNPYDYFYHLRVHVERHAPRNHVNSVTLLGVN